MSLNQETSNKLNLSQADPGRSSLSRPEPAWTQQGFSQIFKGLHFQAFNKIGERQETQK